MPDHCPHSDHPIADEQSAAGATKPAAGQAFWRSLDELAQTPEFREYLEREFPDRASEWRDPTSRREFLKLMSASLALAGVAAGTTGCDSTQTPDEKIVPYVSPPENMVPGKPQYYATTFPFGGYGLGVLAESHTGRPTKIEGNPDHPASLGATDLFAQASILSLYDPDRSRTIMRAGVTSTWNTFLVELRRVMDAKRKVAGKGLRVLTDTVTSPTLIAQIQDLLKQLPDARWHRYEPVTHDNVRQGAQVAFGRPVETVYRFGNAQRVLALDAEFSCFGPAGVRYAREFSRTRRVRKSNPTQEKPQDAAHGSTTMSRLYVVESTPTTTGASADHRISLRASDIAIFARALAAQLGVGSASGAGQLPPSISQEWLAALTKDLKDHNGRSIVVVGEYQPPEVHALAHAMNLALGAVGQTVNYIEPLETNTAGDVESMRTLVEEMKSGACDTLIILCGNPAFTAPADVGFADALTAFSNQLADDKRTARNFTVHLGQYYDETAFRCQWHLPESHYLEAWGDIRAFDGTVSIVQPLIAPLYQTRSTHEFLAAMLGQDVQAGREIIRNHWMNQRQGADFEPFWRTALQRGVVEGTTSQPVQVALAANFQAAPATQPESERQRGFELIFRPDPTIWDGRYANNGWLQELPKPLTKIVWDNVALISYRTAQQLNVGNGDLVILQYKTRRLRIPVWILPGQPDGSVTVHLGYGRQMGGAVAKDRGFNAYQLRTTENMWFASGLEITKVGRKYAIATTQPHHLITTEAVTKRELIHVHTLEEFQKLSHPPDKPHNEPETGHGQTVHLSLYPEYDYSDGRAWGMSIDQTACMGCNACVVACQAENNIPVVGKEQVATSREMHWLRIDTYYRGNPEDPEGPFFQPMLCQHCEKAPCEVVCPVEATTHSNEGINEMTYNRCIGTRYCSNNCPYKVRRFNFFQYADKRTPSIQLMYNPDVTVRVRGVMEKCTFCVQRVNVTRRDLKKLEVEASVGTPDQKKRAREEMDRLHRDLQTACQQACPSEAIVFGDLNWKYADGSATHVQRLRTEPHGYGVLTELNTQPRINYLARVMNVNPDLPRPVQTSPAAREPEKKARA